LQCLCGFGEYLFFQGSNQAEYCQDCSTGYFSDPLGSDYNVYQCRLCPAGLVCPGGIESLTV
jgi:hypothetical protein